MPMAQGRRASAGKLNRTYRMPLSWWWGFLTALALATVVLLSAAGVVYSKAPTQAHPEARGFKPVDVIVCLTGGRGRIRQALQLLDKQVGERLYIAGVDPSVNMRQILREIHWVGPLDNGRIIIDQRSTNTIENAQEVRRYLEEKNLSSVLVVTSSYHARRAHYIFEKVLHRRDYRIEMTWQDREPFDQGDWWKSPTGIWVTTSEYVKFFWAYLRLHVLAT